MLAFKLRSTVLSVCLIFYVNIISSQENILSEKPSQTIEQLEDPIKFDGIISEREWDKYKQLSMISHWPNYSETPNDKTQVYIVYDDEALYVAAKCFDDPENIQVQSFERDILSMATDQISLMLDTYNDNENGLFFGVSPSGSRSDLSIRNDAQGDSPIDLSWNSFWEAKVSYFSEGWMTEIKIPFSSLRFQPKDGKIKMGLILYRYAAKDRAMDIFPDVRPDWGFWSFVKPSQAFDIVIPSVKNKRPWFTSPYALANGGYHHQKTDSQEEHQKVNDNKITAGIDIQHAITDNLNLDLSVNTDFAQVEADDQVVNLSRFSLFFPEKRRFFLERSSIMDFRFENNNRLFYSRRIGINDGQIVPLWGGARIVGRIKDFDIGVMSMQSRAFENFDSENFGIIRLRKKISSNNSYIGGILTNRINSEGETQLSYGFDGIINVFKDDYLKINFANTNNASSINEYDHFLQDRKRIYIMWENRSQVGFNYTFNYSQADQDYSPAIGFEERRNFISFGETIGYGKFFEGDNVLRLFRANIQSQIYLSANTKKLESYLIAPDIILEWDNSSSVNVAYNYFYDDVPSPFNLSDDVEISIDKYVNKDATITLQSPRTGLFNTTLNGVFGSFYGGNRMSLGVTPTYIISKYISLSGFYQYNRIKFENGLYNAHIGRLKISGSFNVKLSINAFIQHNSISKTNAINVRLRYNSKDGNDLYVVYNETLNGNGQVDPLIPYSDYRGLTLKYIHTFKL